MFDFSAPIICRALEIRRSARAQYDLEQRSNLDQMRCDEMRQCNGGGRDEFERFLNGPFQR